jgi:hypothetical protein
MIALAMGLTPPADSICIEKAGFSTAAQTTLAAICHWLPAISRFVTHTLLFNNS